MFQLTGCFLKTDNDLEAAEAIKLKSPKKFFSISIAITPNRTDVLYFESSTQQKRWVDALQHVMGYSNVHEAYKFGKTLG